MKMKYILLFITVVVILSGCETTIEVDLPPEDPKLVIQSFISPQEDEIKVRVTLSKPIFRSNNSNHIDFVEDASVIISDGINSLELTYNPTDQYYTDSSGSFKIEQGKQYFLEVTTPDGKNVSASCIVPEKMNESLELVAVDFSVMDMEVTYRAKFQFHDIPNQDNYYRFLVRSNSVSQFAGDTISEVVSPEAEGSIITDNNRDGDIFTLTLEWSTPEDLKLISFKVYLLTTDDHFYHYHKSVYINQEENPFTEPTIVYSNVEGGLGVFASYNQVEDEITL